MKAMTNKQVRQWVAQVQLEKIKENNSEPKKRLRRLNEISLEIFDQYFTDNDSEADQPLTRKDIPFFEAMRTRLYNEAKRLQGSFAPGHFERWCELVVELAKTTNTINDLKGKG